MVVVPASTACCAGIALGLSKDLLQRAAEVNLKERRPLVVVPRETPFTRATLRRLIELDELGAVVLPASPAFYHAPKAVQELVDFVAGKVLDVIGVEHDLFRRWDGPRRRPLLISAAASPPLRSSPPRSSLRSSAGYGPVSATFAPLGTEIGGVGVGVRLGRMDSGLEERARGEGARRGAAHLRRRPGPVRQR